MQQYAQTSPVVKVQAGPLDLLLVTDENLCGSIYQSGNYADKPFVDAILYFRDAADLKDGMSVSNGCKWMRSRGIANKTLMSPGIVQGFAAAMIENADKIVAKWKARGDGVILVAPQMDSYTTDSMGALLFGEKFKCIDEDDCELAKAIAAFMKGTSELLFVPFPYYKYITTPTAKAMHDCLATIKRLGIERIKNKRQQLKNGTLASTKSDFLSLLLTTTDENGQLLSVSEMLADLFDTMVAGQETTSRTLTWALMVLAGKEELQERLFNEIRTKLGDTQNLTTAALDKQNMPLLNNTIKEVLRLYPPIAVYGRRAINDDVLGNYEIPAGTNITLSPWAMGRNPNLWEHPEVFDPDRFERSKHHPFAWIPFGAGRRNCVGQRVALLEAKIMLVKLIEAFKFQRVGDKDPNPIFRLFLCPDKDIEVVIKKRLSLVS